jgi:hypothetical protein
LDCGKIAHKFSLLLQYYKHCPKQTTAQYFGENSPNLVTLELFLQVLETTVEESKWDNEQLVEEKV